jgi:hypothetical protein
LLDRHGRIEVPLSSRSVLNSCSSGSDKPFIRIIGSVTETMRINLRGGSRHPDASAQNTAGNEAGANDSAERQVRSSGWPRDSVERQVIQ